MAATIATMAILNPKCVKSPLTAANSRQKPISLPSIKNLPKNLNAAVAGAFFAALSSGEPAMAAQQIAAIAEGGSGGGDNRGLALLLPIVPAIAWVLFNILQPALNQLNRMRNEKAVVAGLGLAGLILAAPPQSEAAEIAAGGDNRGTLLLLVVLPAIAWVLFNILQPALNQLNRMRSE